MQNWRMKLCVPGISEAEWRPGMDWTTETERFALLRKAKCGSIACA